METIALLGGDYFTTTLIYEVASQTVLTSWDGGYAATWTPDSRLLMASGEGLMLLLHQRGSRHLFASAFETHGFFDGPTERCSGARSELDEIRTLGHDDKASVIELTGKRLQLIVMVSNRPDVTADSVTEVKCNGCTYRWTGFFASQSA